MECLFEELEYILYETNNIKYQLNNVCEETWDILCPPGKKGTGSFQINSHETAQEEDTDNTASSPSQEIINKINKLISYGKFVRNESSPDSNNKNSQKISVNSFKVNRSQTKSMLPSPNAISNSNVSQYNNQSISLERKITATNNADIKPSNINNRKLTTKNEQNNAPTLKSSFLLSQNTISHTCSHRLDDFLKEVKMPDDVLNVLKQYHKYEFIKMEHDNEQQKLHTAYRDKYLKLVEAKLLNDINYFVKDIDHYIKLMEIADGMKKKSVDYCKGGEELCFYYQSEEDLLLYNEKCCQLLELKFQSRIAQMFKKLFSGSDKNVN